ncbi:MAG TPA: ADOP family duplicated permease [Longimicrobiales bacterium]
MTRGTGMGHAGGGGPGPSPLPRVLRIVAGAILGLYPARFREESGADFMEAVGHRWDLERRGGRGAPGAFLRWVFVLAADAMHAVPALRHRGVRASSPSFWGGLGGDLRLALRMHGRRPGFAALVILTLGIGIGSNAAIFGALDRFVLHPLPFADGDRMVYLALQSEQRGGRVSPGQLEFERWRAGARTLTAIEVFRQVGALAPAGGTDERLSRTSVTEGLPRMLGLRPVVGRAFGPDDARADAPATLMLSEPYWRRAHGADPAVVGRTMTLSDTVFTVIGVWPAEATLDFGDLPDVWTAIRTGDEANASYWSPFLAVMAPGVTPGMVESELASLIEGEDLRPGSANTWVPAVAAPSDFLSSDFVTGLWVVWIGVALLLAVAVINVANLLLDRAVTRSGEIAVRQALGASGGGLVRLFVADGAMLSMAGGALGLLLAHWGMTALARITPTRFPDLTAHWIEPRAMAYAAGIAVVASLLCGLVPALHVRSPQVKRRLTNRTATEGRRRLRGREALVGVQIAMALVLVVGASLGLRSLEALASVDPGFDVDRLVIGSVSLPRARYPEPEDRTAFWARAREAFRDLPGVQGLTTSGVPPFSFSLVAGLPHLDGEEPIEAGSAWTAQASAAPGYFDVMGIPLLEGRGARAEDAGQGRRVVVNEEFARRYPHSVVGRTMRIGTTSTSMEIVGVAANVRTNGLDDDEIRPTYWVVDTRADDPWTRFILRTEADPALVLQAFKERLAALDPGLALSGATTGPDMLRAQTADGRFLAVLLAAFAALSMLVAVLGVYGSVSLAVNRRTRELGLRRALGAAAPDVVRLIMARALRPVVLGLVVGLPLTAFLARFAASALYTIGATDPISYAAGVGILTAAAVAACLGPARRALRVDTVETLKSE